MSNHLDRLSINQLLERADDLATNGDSRSIECYDKAIAKLIVERNEYAIAVGHETVEVNTVSYPNEEV